MPLAIEQAGSPCTEDGPAQGRRLTRWHRYPCDLGTDPDLVTLRLTEERPQRLDHPCRVERACHLPLETGLLARACPSVRTVYATDAYCPCKANERCRWPFSRRALRDEQAQGRSPEAEMHCCVTVTVEESGRPGELGDTTHRPDVPPVPL